MSKERSEDGTAGNQKRSKNLNEAILPVKKLKKVAYFPVNTLTEPKKNTPIQHSPIRPLDPNTFGSKILPVVEVRKKSSSNTSQNLKQQELTFLQENSDDSFDGIRWRESPNKQNKARVKAAKSLYNGLPSSPLNNTCASVDEENVDNRTMDVLNRYGTVFSNSSMIPTAGITKSCSDISDISSRLHHELPQARRAKSGEDFRTKKQQITATDPLENTLNSWISKFETEPKDENREIKSTFDKVKEDNPNVTIASEDPFSDDEDLIEVLQTQSQVRFKRALQEKIDNAPPQSSVSENDSSDDPFSEDDSELMEMLATQVAGSTSAKFGRTFQKGIKNAEKLMTNRKSPFGAESVNDDNDNDNDNDELKSLVYDKPMVKRCKIRKIVEHYFGPRKEKQLLIDVVNPNKDMSKLVVRGDYCELGLQVNDIVNVIVTHPSNPNLVDNTHNLLIWNPDILISATTIAQQLGCSRKTVILSRYKIPGKLSLPIIVGEIVHFIFQECICTEDWSISFMNKVLDDLLQQYLLAIFGICKDVDDVRKEVVKHFEYLETWFKTYYKQPLSNANYIEELSEKHPIKFAVDKAIDIEEEIRSPIFGIKGKVDATITAKFSRDGVDGTFMIPMEIKTGKPYMYHNAQASLYALLFQDRYDFLINSYLLVYTKEKRTTKCNIRISDLRSLVILRNRLSLYIKDNLKLPPLVKNSECDICPIKNECMTLNHLVEDGTKNECGIAEDEYQAITRDIFANDIYRDFFLFWDELLASEEDILGRTVKDLWTMTGPKRQELGKCFTGMNIVLSNDKDTSNFLFAAYHGDKSSSPQFEYTFKKNKDSIGINLRHSQLNVGDRVIVSDEAGQFAITTGSVKELTHDTITISSRRRILTSDNKLKHYNNCNNQVFESVLRPSQLANLKSEEKKFRIDKDEVFYGLALARYNVLNLFLPDGASNIRRLIVDYQKPTFKNKPMWEIPNKNDFNADQIAAMEKVFSSNDYTLILGMPGTGKTTMIAEMIKIFVSQDKSVLLTSYTNSAVDNILRKLKDLEVEFLRVGYPRRVHKDIHPYIPGFKEPITTYNQYVNTYMSPKVVAATCLGITDICFDLRKSFDICIVDEASQISLPINLGPLRFSEKFVLVGDHNQLPPLVKHPDQRVKQGLSESLFKKLESRHPESLSMLTYQYRMCQDIMDVSNILIYKQRLKCGSEEVANRSLSIPNPGILNDLQFDKSLTTKDQWMSQIFLSNNKVLFLDHDQLPALEVHNGEMVRNPVEARLVEQVVGALVMAGVQESQIGVMSLYRSQLHLLERKLSLRTGIEILTADQYQGRDKECIIISLVRSNEHNNAGDLLNDWRRLNVAITRAKSKLIILGSRSTLSSTETTKTFIDFLEEKGWYYLLPQRADMIYNIPDQGSVSSPVKSKRRSQDPRFLLNHPVLLNVMEDISK